MKSKSPLGKTLLGAAAAVVATAQLATAAVVETDQTQANGTYTIPTTNDLILNATATASTGNFAAEGAASLGNLTNGLFGAAGDTGATATGGPGAGTSVTFSLGTNATGYNLTEIQSYSGWPDDGRYQQAFSVYYSLASSPTTFNLLYTVNPYPASTFGANQSFVSLTSNSGPLASNVAAVQITYNAVANGYTGYRELVINGVASTVPEPSAYVLMAAGGALLAGFAVRRSRPAC